MVERSSYTVQLPADKIPQLKADLEARGFMFRDLEYTHFAAEHRGERVNVALYTSGKFVIQGKGTTDFIQFYLEPVLLGEARLGYEHIHNPSMLDARIGVDESGKGDFFGPLVVAGVFLDATTAMQMHELGVKDSKMISSDAKIEALAKEIRAATKWDVLPIGNEAYNRLQSSMGNVNSLLGWGHARVIENMLAKVPTATKAISDQFGNKRIIEKALMERGQKIELVQRHKAESDLAVAAASILARAEFVRKLKLLGKQLGVVLPKGASAAVEAAARVVVQKHGSEALAKIAKLHFRTTQKVLEGVGT
ncbi:MAG: ribonuclease HIII [Verrucomicrobiota bacterium]